MNGEKNMNQKLWIRELGINQRTLQAKKQQTEYKIKYVVEYVKEWILVNTNRSNVTNINFIDCMCNAGIYLDGDFCTSMEVLQVFVEAAKKHPDKRFNLFLNEKDQKRIAIIELISNKITEGQTLSNIAVEFKNEDVNDYLIDFGTLDKKLTYNCATVLFVDPYDFGTVQIDKLKKFICKYYCEVIFNFFISDYVRNGIDSRIRSCIGEAQINNKDELIDYIVNNIKVGKMKYIFSYKFKTITNTELYQIIFVTPHIRGLEKLKVALWTTFNGKFYHQNNYINPNQQSLFSIEDERQMILSIHAKEACEITIRKFAKQTVSYKEIEAYLIENSMLFSLT